MASSTPVTGAPELDASILALPFLPLPEGDATCTISPIINSLVSLKEPIVLYPSPNPQASFRAPSFVFHIVHKPTGKSLLYDLGIRWDYETAFSEDYVKVLNNLWKTKIVDDVGKILEKGGVDPAKVHALLFSHEHWDHTGFIAPFTGAELTGGPQTFAAEANLSEQVKALGKTPRIIDFSGASIQPVGAFERGFDYFGDGSVWLIHTPGHTKDHMSALVRVTPSPEATYVLVGGDTAHHPCLLCTHASHSQYQLRATFRNPLAAEDAPEVAMHFDADLARDSIKRTKRMEAEGNVMCVMAHEYGYWKYWRGNEEVMFPGFGLGEWKKRGLKGTRVYDVTEYEE
ncbi:Metallo-hydrolase/oxidoreductase [Calocera viscosa TUFC12733]|uniref:Metallo-hydrolase/oxidoreductase n=1 Tax=Calocera viscosa (strain TUFC12733) TaxID=1330018 RepID=A0A167MV62_CALVF|nr:Metallo-hydrolase/oxidoreductase [Calocera viscosa TUFC12733]